MAKTSNASLFEKDVLSKDSGRVTVFFYSEEDEVSAAQEAIISEVDTEHSDIMTFVKINFDENKDLAKEYGILYSNVYMYFKDGNLVSKFEKVASKEKLIKRVSLDHDYDNLPEVLSEEEATIQLPQPADA